MADVSDDLQKQIDGLSAVIKFNAKTASEYSAVLADRIEVLRKDVESLKSAAKAMDDLKSRVKDIETKLGKMGKK